MAAVLCRSFNILAHGSSSILSPLQGRFSYRIVFAVIGMQTLGGGSSNTELGNDRPDRTGYIGLEGNRPAETEINQADRQGGPGKHGVEQAGGRRS